MIELEKTYLIKYIPAGLQNCEFEDMLDIYIPQEEEHPVLRIRKKGSQYEITKKRPVDGDYSKQTEETIPLTKSEYEDLSTLKGKRIAKHRYKFMYNERVAEIDIFLGELKGLILVDFEFDNEDERDSFKIPEFCLVDVTQETFIAGGKLCGKSYKDIENILIEFGYTPQFLS